MCQILRNYNLKLNFDISCVISKVDYTVNNHLHYSCSVLPYICSNPQFNCTTVRTYCNFLGVEKKNVSKPFFLNLDLLLWFLQNYSSNLSLLQSYNALLTQYYGNFSSCFKYAFVIIFVRNCNGSNHLHDNCNSLKIVYILEKFQ